PEFFQVLPAVEGSKRVIARGDDAPTLDRAQLEDGLRTVGYHIGHRPAVELAILPQRMDVEGARILTQGPDRPPLPRLRVHESGIANDTLIKAVTPEVFDQVEDLGRLLPVQSPLDGPRDELSAAL